MKLYNLPVLLFSVMFFLCCRSTQPPPPFTRTESTVKYLKEVHNLDVRNRKTLFFIITGSCGSCTKHTVRFVHELDEDPKFNSWQKILVTGGSEGDTLMSKFATKTFILKKDKDFALEKYGLMLLDDMLIEFTDSGSVSYYEHLQGDKINNAVTRYYH